MNNYIGNIWDLHSTHYIVIPTNIGWTKEGKNVMGAGLAKQAAQRFPELPKKYGNACKLGEDAAFCIALKERLVLFPVKPLNKQQPWLSWKNKADLDLIEQSCIKLKDFIGRPFAMPLVGCGNGGLSQDQVLPIIDKYFSKNSYITMVRQKHE